ncbi:MAG TPA: hypothetical protein PLU50_06870, partial [Pseudobdellovibrionaceae bacterium]|nr:hypothetical protein [Pseudobdellovibrionaceae bacterium]
MVEISYDELIKEYNSSLANVLRGFRPKYDFLQQWVPDANLMKSIVNLVESAHSYGMPQLSLRVDQQVLKGIEFNELKNEISEFCQLEVINQGDAALLKFNGLIPLNGMLVKTHIIEENEIPEIYKCQLLEVLKDIQHESTVVDDDRHLLIRGNINGCSLFLSIEPTKHIIAKTAFSGANSDIDRAVMEAFCRLIQGMSIQEASDHGVIRLEYKLRDHDTRRPVPGIVNPFNIHRIFQLPMKLIRSIRQKYAEDHQFTETRNFWDDPVSANWQQATLDERLHR